ncbi:hypothetical protein FE634_14500 [Nocardioides dongxiaopingii]|uniref:hypothetical protein n=1 Tax=Nocardioides sp. S-1144 TaxID=2582905 RepID=UPI00110DC754|nr:hypothetical protein [Nocardioides sp. S-1144]QCW51308.1 hypothetical protein FE634_14500 [Nocardioides sp. S-1144]
MSTDEGVRVDQGGPETPSDGTATPPTTTTPHEPTPVDGPADDPAADPAADPAPSSEDDGPRFWHREHPVFTPLAGFFAGVAAILVALLALGWLLDTVIGYDVSDQPWILLVAVGLVLVVDLVLIALPGTRRFARYMLFGVLLTPLVVALTAVATTYLLLRSDG